jgi:hypothetical protein
MGGGRAFLFASFITRSLKVPTVLVFLGGILFLSGQALFAASFFQGADGAVAMIPAGPTWAYVYEIKVLGASRVFGQFADPAGGLVDLFVFEQAQYERFHFDGTGTSLSSARGASGSFSVSLPVSGTYYLVLAHGAGFEYSGQAVHVSYRVAGIQPEFLGIGLPFVAVGIVGVGLGLRARTRRDGLTLAAEETSR